LVLGQRNLSCALLMTLLVQSALFFPCKGWQQLLNVPLCTPFKQRSHPSQASRCNGKPCNKLCQFCQNPTQIRTSSNQCIRASSPIAQLQGCYFHLSQSWYPKYITSDSGSNLASSPIAQLQGCYFHLSQSWYPKYITSDSGSNLAMTWP